LIQAVEKLRCILSLPHLFPNLARRFACCQSCSVSLRTLWAYGFDSAAPRTPEKSKIGEKEKYFIPLPKVIREVLADNLFGLSAVLTAQAGV